MLDFGLLLIYFYVFIIEIESFVCARKLRTK